ncbi:hypothetical protein TK90_0908 [Thioalkalivibrio sp. K90mix]|uniref:hypothetical protein n=1 Tax=unclassified Thioalkalivibrio TaxID=2621013 RepID=UPI000195AAAD|nr:MULTISPECIES: hypothetical protein [unclassified Thioalkalivibrio]ADC71423.1 hypothetical protein TK90_0908 [Thioalkalivibrio sp. K90mix]
MIDGIGMNQAALARPAHSAQATNNAGQAGNQAAQAGPAAHAQPAQQAQAAMQAQGNGPVNGLGAGVSTSPHVAQPAATTHAPTAHEAAFSPQGINASPPTQATAMPLAGGQVNGTQQADDAPRMDADPDDKADMGQTFMPDGSVQSNSNEHLGSHFDLQA